MLLFTLPCGLSRLLLGIVLISLCAGVRAPAQATGGATVSVWVTWDAVPSPNVAGYVVYYGTESGNYTQSIDVGNETRALIPSLFPGLTYFSAVTAYDAGHVESPFSNEISFTLEAGPEGRLIMLEAEDASVLAPMYIGAEFEPPNFSEPTVQYVSPLEATETGTATLTFSVPVTANYYVWARVKAPGPGSDSFYVSIDGGPEQVYAIYEFTSPSGLGYSNEWIWSRITFDSSESGGSLLTEGVHSLVVRNREPYAALDCFVLSSDPNFTPSDAILVGGEIVTITIQPQDQTVSEGADAILQVTAAATGPISYQWEKAGTPIQGATEPTLQIFDFQPADGGAYSVVATTGAVSVTSEVAQLSVALPPPGIRSFELLSAGGTISVSLETDAPLDSTIEVYTSSDLENWTLLGSQLNTTGTIVLGDPEAAGEPRRFYRLEVP